MKGQGFDELDVLEKICHRKRVSFLVESDIRKGKGLDLGAEHNRSKFCRIIMPWALATPLIKLSISKNSHFREKEKKNAINALS